MTTERHDGTIQVPPIPVEDLVTRYNKRNGWMPLFEAIASRGAVAWAAFEASPAVKPLRDSLAVLQGKIAKHGEAVARWTRQFRSDLQVAKGELEDAIREAVNNRRVNAERHTQLRTSRGEQAEHLRRTILLDLERAKQERKASLDRQVVGLAGDRNA